MTRIILALLFSMPQLSIHFGLFKIDAYLVLLLFFIVTYAKKNYFEINKLFIFTFILFSFIIIIQLLFHDNGSISGHTKYVDMRDIDTFSYNIKLNEAIFYLIDYIKLIVLIIFSLVIYNYFKKKNYIYFFKFLKNIIYSLSIIQILFYTLFHIGILDNVILLFFQDNIHGLDNYGLMYSHRNDYLRLSGGFSEPSLLALFYFMSLFSLIQIKYYFNIKLKKLDLFLIFLSWFIILFTTISFTHFISLYLFFILLFNKSDKFIGYAILLFLCLIEMVHVLDLEYLKLVNQSFIFRIYYATDLAELNLYQVLFGVGFSNIYAFVQSINLILQLGIIGTFLFLIILKKYLYNFTQISVLIYILFISPRLTDTWIYIAVSFLLIVKFHISNNKKSRNRIIEK